MTRYVTGAMDSVPDRQRFFLPKIQIVGECWEWTGSRHKSGYGWLGLGGPWITLAHRYSYVYYKGPITDGQYVRHTCDNPPCVNPDHLLAGSPLDNVRDMLDRGRNAQPSGERHPHARLSWDQVQEIRRRYMPGLNRYKRGNVAQLAQEFGVSVGYIGRLAKGDWRKAG